MVQNTLHVLQIMLKQNPWMTGLSLLSSIILVYILAIWAKEFYELQFAKLKALVIRKNKKDIEDAKVMLYAADLCFSALFSLLPGMVRYASDRIAFRRKQKDLERQRLRSEERKARFEAESIASAAKEARIARANERKVLVGRFIRRFKFKPSRLKERADRSHLHFWGDVKTYFTTRATEIKSLEAMFKRLHKAPKTEKNMQRLLELAERLQEMVDGYNAAMELVGAFSKQLYSEIPFRRDVIAMLEAPAPKRNEWQKFLAEKTPETGKKKAGPKKEKVIDVDEIKK